MRSAQSVLISNMKEREIFWRQNRRRKDNINATIITCVGGFGLDSSACSLLIRQSSGNLQSTEFLCFLSVCYLLQQKCVMVPCIFGKSSRKMPRNTLPRFQSESDLTVKTDPPARL